MLVFLCASGLNELDRGMPFFIFLVERRNEMVDPPACLLATKGHFFWSSFLLGFRQDHHYLAVAA